LPSRRSKTAVTIVMLSCSLVMAMKSRSGQAANSPSDAQQNNGATGNGRQLFATRCAGCHGLDGKGGERAPDIANSAKTQGRSDEDLFRIVERGVPGTGMPPFASLGTEDVKAVVAHLRILQGRIAIAAAPGNPLKGHTIFYGKGGCADCHMVAGRGGFI